MLRWELATTSLAVLLLMSEVRQAVPIALVLIVLPWPLRLWRQRRLSVGTPLDWPLALLLVTAGVAVWAAYDRALAWPKLWLIVGGMALFYALANDAWRMADGEWRMVPAASRAHGWLLGLCVFTALLGVYFVTQRDWAAEPTKFAAITQLGSWIAAHTPDLPGPDINGNVMAGALAVVFPLNVALVLETDWQPSTRTRRELNADDDLPPAATSSARSPNLPISQSTRQPATLSPCLLVSLLTLLLITFALEMTGSRGAWLAVAAGLGLWLLDALRRRGGRWGDALVVTIIIAALALLIWPGMATRLAHGRLLGSLGAIPVGATALNRVDLFRQAGTLLQDYAFTGSGLGCFMMVYSSYVMLLHVGFITHAHNLFLQIGIEQGLLALAAFVWLLAAFFWAQRSPRPLSGHSRRHGERPAIRHSRSAITGAAACSVLVIIVHGLVDASLYASRTLPFLFVPLGLGMGTGYWRLGTGYWRLEAGGSGLETGDQPPGISDRGGSEFGVLGSEFGVRSSEFGVQGSEFDVGEVAGPEQPSHRSHHASQVPDHRSQITARSLRFTHYVSRILLRAWPLAAVAIVALAVMVAPPLRAAFVANLGAAGQTRAELSLYEWPTYPIQDAVRREIDLSRPVGAFERALASDPGNATANRRLGMIELSLGEYRPALQHLTSAYAAEPGNQTTRQLLGEALIVNGKVDEGAALWTAVNNAQGQLAARQWWYEHIGEAQRAEWIRQARGA